MIVNVANNSAKIDLVIDGLNAIECLIALLRYSCRAVSKSGREVE
jgi:hypothetical protein